MGDSGWFWTFVLVALLVPILLLWVVRLMAWALPPPCNRLVAFFQRHPLPIAYAEAALWSYWFLQGLRRTNKSWDEWLFCVLAGLLAAETLARIWRERRTRPEDPPAPAAA